MQNPSASGAVVRRAALPIAGRMLTLLTLGLLLNACGGGARISKSQSADTRCYGVNYVSFYNDAQQGYGGANATQQLGLLAQNTSANCVALVQNWVMDTPQSTTVRERVDDPPSANGRTATRAQFRQALKTLRSLRLKVLVKPHVDVLDGSFRGDVHFDKQTDFDAWFDTYRALMLDYATMAQEEGVDSVVIGTELDGLADQAKPYQTARWRGLIQDIRSRFKGQLTYAANWPTATSIGFWDPLDYLGIDAYFSLADASVDAPGVAALNKGWQGYDNPPVGKPLPYLQSLATQFGKSILFTEVGYRSRSGCANHPEQYADLNDSDPGNDFPLNEICQAHAYQALFDSVSDQPWFMGALFWNWETYPGAGSNARLDDSNASNHNITRGFTSQAKPAQKVLQDGIQALRLPAN